MKAALLRFPTLLKEKKKKDFRLILQLNVFFFNFFYGEKAVTKFLFLFLL